MHGHMNVKFRKISFYITLQYSEWPFPISFPDQIIKLNKARTLNQCINYPLPMYVYSGSSLYLFAFMSKIMHIFSLLRAYMFDIINWLKYRDKYILDLQGIERLCFYMRDYKIAKSGCKLHHACLSVCLPHGRTRLTPDGFSWNLKF
jgi:hypothetical protein